jgi:hypothetical protein
MKNKSAVSPSTTDLSKIDLVSSLIEELEKEQFNKSGTSNNRGPIRGAIRRHFCLYFKQCGGVSNTEGQLVRSSTTVEGLIEKYEQDIINLKSCEKVDALNKVTQMTLQGVITDLQSLLTLKQ